MSAMPPSRRHDPAWMMDYALTVLSLIALGAITLWGSQVSIAVAGTPVAESVVVAKASSL